MKQVLIVDDALFMRNLLRDIFEADGWTVVAEAENGREAVSRTEVFNPDVVLMDLRMPVLDGVGATREIVERGLGARVLIVTTYDTESDVLPAIEAGATGYLLKDTPRDELRRAVRAAAAGESVLSPPVARQLLGQVRRPTKETLSDREMEILATVAKGATNKEIAARLFISEATVKTHLIHIYDKLSVKDRAGAVGAAYERGLLTPGEH